MVRAVFFCKACRQPVVCQKARIIAVGVLAAKVGYVRTADQQLAKMLHPCANGSFRKIAVQRFGFPLTTEVGRKANFAKSVSCAYPLHPLDAEPVT